MNVTEDDDAPDVDDDENEDVDMTTTTLLCFCCRELFVVIHGAVLDLMVMYLDPWYHSCDVFILHSR